MDVCATLQGYAMQGHDWPTIKLVMLDDVTDSKMFTRLLHAYHMCSVWTCSHLWREQEASSEPDNSGVPSWIPVDSHSPVLWAQVPLEGSGPLATLIKALSDVLVRNMHTGCLEVIVKGSGSTVQILVLLLGWCLSMALSSSRCLMASSPVSPPRS